MSLWVSLCLAMALFISSCSASSPPTVVPKGGKISPVPSEIAELALQLEALTPKVSILEPQPDQVLSEKKVTLRFGLEGYRLFKDPEYGLGPHLHVVLDNQPYIPYYDLTTPLTLDNLSPGSHTVRVFVGTPWHESFKNREAYAQVTFHVLAKTPEYVPDPALPLLTYNRPVGSYGAEPILVDFWLHNAPIRESLLENLPKDWRIRYTLNGHSGYVSEWQPFYLSGWQSGTNIFELELVDSHNRPIRNVFNSAVREITYTPNGQDTLARLIRGELKANQVIGILPLAPSPLPTVLPTSTPSATPSPTPTPEPQPTLTTIPEITPEIKPELKPEPNPDTASEISPLPTATSMPEPTESPDLPTPPPPPTPIPPARVPPPAGKPTRRPLFQYKPRPTPTDIPKDLEQPTPPPTPVSSPELAPSPSPVMTASPIPERSEEPEEPTPPPVPLPEMETSPIPSDLTTVPESLSTPGAKPTRRPLYQYNYQYQPKNAPKKVPENAPENAPDVLSNKVQTTPLTPSPEVTPTLMPEATAMPTPDQTPTQIPTPLPPVIPESSPTPTPTPPQSTPTVLPTLKPLPTPLPKITPRPRFTPQFRFLPEGVGGEQPFKFQKEPR